MQLTLNKQSALFLLRMERRERGKHGLPRARVNLLAPNPNPRTRWSKRLFASMLPPSLDFTSRPLEICVSSDAERPKSRSVSNTIYGSSLPSGSFIRLNEQIAISSPELLFVELANELPPAQHLLLGFELCGSFSRDERNPIGRGTMWLPPATSVARVRSYMDGCKYLAGLPAARRTLSLLADNAWSPMEAVVAVMMALPLEENGYGLGRCALNLRYETPAHLVGSAAKESRVPDIMVEGTHVGINYEGGGHLDLDSIVEAAMRLQRHIGSQAAEEELDEVIARVRAKIVDDGRRNRELAADGLSVFQVYSEDLYEDGGLDAVMMQVLEALKLNEKWEVAERQRALQSALVRKERQELLHSMLPGRDWPVVGDVHEAYVKIRGLKGLLS